MPYRDTGKEKSHLKIGKEKTGPCEYTLNIEIEPERIQEPLHQAAQRLSRYRPLAGFRPGKAPYNMVERVFGKDMIYREMLDKVGNDWYKEALQESQLEPYAQGEMEIAQLEPLTLKVNVPVEPQVTLGDYGRIRVKQKAVKVTKAEVEETLRQIQDSNAVWQPVEQPVQIGNQVVLDAIGKTEDGKPTEQRDLTVEVSEEMVPVGFGQNLVGMKAGETKEFHVDYPADFRDQNLAGKRVDFAVTVKSVKQKELPALNDELAKGAGSETLADLRAKIKEELQKHKEETAREEALDKALSALVEGATLEYPAAAVEHEIDDMMASLNDRLTRQGFTMDGYLQMVKKTLPQVREERRTAAEERLKRGLALIKFAEAEGIKVEPEEIDQEAARFAESFGEGADSIKEALASEQWRRSLTSDVFRRKALDRLLATATGQAKQTVATASRHLLGEVATAQPEDEKEAPQADATAQANA
jgi:trigger factor